MTTYLTDSISAKAFNVLIRYLDSSNLISTESLVKEAGYNTEQFSAQELNDIDLSLRTFARENNIVLDSGYMGGLMIADRYSVPFKAERLK